MIALVIIVAAAGHYKRRSCRQRNPSIGKSLKRITRELARYVHTSRFDALPPASAAKACAPS